MEKRKGREFYDVLLSELSSTAYAVERMAGLSNGTVGKSIKNDTPVSLETIERIAAAYPFLNREWLRTGNGPVRVPGYQYEVADLASDGNFPRSKKRRKPEGSVIGEPGATYTNKTGQQFQELGDGMYLSYWPEITIAGAANYHTSWGDPEYIAEMPVRPVITNRPVKGDYKWFNVAFDNESMNDGSVRAILPKDKIWARRIPRSAYRDSKLHLKDFSDYVIHHNDGFLFKEIIEHDTEAKTITIRSRNPDRKKYPDQVINLDEVRELYNIIKVEHDWQL